MKNYIFITGLLVFFGCANSIAASEDGGYAGGFLKIAVAARPAAMGGAYIAVSNDASGQLHNPAGVQAITEDVFTSSYRAMKLGRKLGFLSVVFSTKRESVLGLSWLYVGYGEVEERDDNGYATGNLISSSEHAFAVSFAKRFTPFLGLGTKLNYYAKSHAGLASNTIGINLGATLYIDSLLEYGTMEDKFVTDITAGLVVNNIAAEYPWETEGEGLAAARNDRFPTVLGAGASCRTLKRKLLVAVDVEKNFEQNLLVRFGGEYRLNEFFLLRGGLNDGTLTAGAGFNFVLEKLILSVDYAFSNDRVGEGEDHIFTFNISF